MTLRYGRRSPVRKDAIKLSSLLTGYVPAYPQAADYLANLPGWQMLGNDQAGDCVAVTWANVRRLVSTVLGTPSYPNQAAVWTIYKTQNPQFDINGDPSVNGPGSPADGGMDIQTLLEFLVATGGPDGVKALGFAQVDHTNPDECKAAVGLFGYLWTGVNVLATNMPEFDAKQPWDYDPNAATDGGHSVLTGGYGPPGAGPLAGDMRFITWAEETSFTDAFWTNCVEEAWVAIWPEHMGSREFVAGVNMSQFAADYTAITGKPWVGVVPQARFATNADVRFAATLRSWTGGLVHNPERVDAVHAAALEWLREKRLE